MAFSTNGAERMRLDSSGNLGLGVTPSAFSTGKAMQIGALNGITLFGFAGGAEFGSNFNFDSSYKYTTTGASARYTTGGGTHAWYIAPSGTAGNNITFTQAMTLNASGDLGLGTTTPSYRLDVQAPTNTLARIGGSGTGQAGFYIASGGAFNPFISFRSSASTVEAGIYAVAGSAALVFATGSSDTERARITAGGDIQIRTADSYLYSNATSGGTTIDCGFQFISSTKNLTFWSNNAERARITAGGEFCVGKTAGAIGTAGIALYGVGALETTRSGGECINVNRLASDGNLIRFFQDTVEEGTISVSGTTVSYNGGHLSRWSQTTDNTRIPLLKGTVMSNLDQMAVWEKDGQPLPNEQLNCMKVSDVEGDVNVAGVFVNWDNDDDEYTNDMNVAMTGDMIIRIAQGVVVQRGDLLMSAGDGTAKPQGDDIRRSKTVAKVTSTHVTCTYDDGSYCVPCVLMAC
jgi:hypothetical protein